MHIAQIGTGRVGRPTAYAIMSTGLADELTVCDIKPNLAAGFAEDLRHAAASLRVDVEVIPCEHPSLVSGADVILVSAGQPRPPSERGSIPAPPGMGSQRSRRDLATLSAKTVSDIAMQTAPNNPGAKYIVITNPADSMAMICRKFSRAKFVISTGTSLESNRFRSKLACALDAPVTKVQGWVGGEHGEAAVILWSQARAYGMPPEEYASSKDIRFDRAEIESYVKTVSRFVIDSVGGTEFGPAATFVEIARAIINNTDQVFSVATPVSFKSIPEPVHVGCPIRLGWQIGPSLFDGFAAEEQERLEEAARAIYSTYQVALSSLEGVKAEPPSRP